MQPHVTFDAAVVGFLDVGGEEACGQFVSRLVVAEAFAADAFPAAGVGAVAVGCVSFPPAFHLLSP